ncbi:MAG: DNA pilot protein [Microvirus sp.]|nr:MAG: DNA pilot protein [Microvirus sp.]
MLEMIPTALKAITSTVMNNDAFGENKKNQELANQAQAYSAEQAQKAMDFESKQSQINRDFQERMSNTAMSRQMEDLKNAGINPTLVSASGASSPSGNSASSSVGQTFVPQFTSAIRAVAGLFKDVSASYKSMK